MAKGKKWIFNKEFDGKIRFFLLLLFCTFMIKFPKKGFPTDENLKLVELDLPEKLEDNGDKKSNYTVFIKYLYLNLNFKLKEVLLQAVYFTGILMV